jgi:hypothetical protein
MGSAYNFNNGYYSAPSKEWNGDDTDDYDEHRLS